MGYDNIEKEYIKENDIDIKEFNIYPFYEKHKYDILNYLQDIHKNIIYTNTTRITNIITLDTTNSNTRKYINDNNCKLLSKLFQNLIDENFNDDRYTVSINYYYNITYTNSTEKYIKFIIKIEKQGIGCTCIIL